MAEAVGSYPRLFQHAGGQVEWRPLGTIGISVAELSGRRFVLVQPEAVAALAEAAFADVSHLFRASHLAQLRTILDDPEASANDRFVARELLKNAVISAEGEFPSCQDTGTAIVLGEKGQFLLVEGSLHDALCGGIEAVWRTRNLRFSQMAALSMFEERNTGNNLPAQVEIEAGEGDALDLLFVAKGGGSANKTFLFQETRRVLEPDRLLAFLDEKVRTLGTAACPPYHLAIVIGGLSAEQTLRTVKLASTRALDDLPTTGDLTGRAFRDLGLERDVHRLTGNSALARSSAASTSATIAGQGDPDCCATRCSLPTGQRELLGRPSGQGPDRRHRPTSNGDRSGAAHRLAEFLDAGGRSGRSRPPDADEIRADRLCRSQHRC